MFGMYEALVYATIQDFIRINMKILVSKLLLFIKGFVFKNLIKTKHKF